MAQMAKGAPAFFVGTSRPEQTVALRVKPDDFYENWFLHILSRKQDGKLFEAKLTWEERESTTYISYHSELLLDKSGLQRLFDDLWNIGIRPSVDRDPNTVQVLQDQNLYLRDMTEKLLEVLLERPPTVYIPNASMVNLADPNKEDKHE